MTSGADDTHEVRRLIRQGWGEVASEYAKDCLYIVARSGWRLPELLGPSPGSTLLDVGTGGGAVALQARARVGAEGQATGSDIAAAMVMLAKQSAVEVGITDITSCRIGDFNALMCLEAVDEIPQAT